MSRRRSESQLVKLRKRAHHVAAKRKETMSTVHLLAAICHLGGSGRELLAARRLDEATVLKAARAFDEHEPTAMDDALANARDLARRAAVPAREAFPGRRGARPAAAAEPGGIHLLVVLLSNRRCSAFRALSQCGVDINRLRTAATRVALGMVAPPRPMRREPERGASAASTTTVRNTGLRAAGRRRGKAVEVPLLPRISVSKPAASAKEMVSSAPPDQAAEPQAECKPTREPVTRKPTTHTPAPRTRTTGTSMRSAMVAAADDLLLDPKSFPVLSNIGHNLTWAAASGRAEPIVGRDQEIEQVLDILAKRHANNPLLVGPAGVGKTSVAFGLAAHFARQSQPRLLIELPLGELLAGTVSRGSLAERLAAVRAEVKAARGRIVLFIDELHELLAAGADEGVAELKMALARGDFPLVASTSPNELRRSVEVDAALARRFSVVEIDEPNEADACLLLQAVCTGLGGHHGVSYSEAAIGAAVSWSIRYLPGRALPDKAVSLLDLAGARLRRRDAAQGVVEPVHVAAVLSESADVPIERLLQTDHERMLKLPELLGERVVGHEEACTRIAGVLRRNAAGLRGRRPIGTLLLLGPTGVGKTETAKAVAELLFHSPDAMTRLDMSEYAEAHAVARLMGAPPGYVGHEAGGALTEAVRKRPYQVVLLDEIEKAHRDVLLSFLQVFDEGRLTDGRGRTVDFTHTVIILTSNIGSEELRAAMNEKRVGFGQRKAPRIDAGRMREVANRSARDTLPPELYNRIDEVIFFAHLNRDHVRSIAKRLLASLGAKLRARNISLDIDATAIDALLEQGGYDPELGARPMRRAIARLVEAPLADMILGGEVPDGSVVLVSADDSGIVVDAVEPAESGRGKRSRGRGGRDGGRRSA